MRLSNLFLLGAFVGFAAATVHDFEALGAVADDGSNVTTLDANAALLNHALQSGVLAPGDTLLFPNKTFHLQGGITASGLRNVTLQFDGTLSFASDRKRWPKKPDGKVMNCLELEDAENLLLTSSGTGVLQGNGKAWWLGIPQHSEDRPKLLQIADSARIVVEHLHFLNSPYWSTDFKDVDTVTIRHCDVAVRWNAGARDHGALELAAANTDGFDLSGSNVHIHDVNIWNQDDCVCVKNVKPGSRRASCSENWLVERVHASGLGLTIGSIGCSASTTHVRNICQQLPNNMTTNGRRYVETQ